jgi:hypothetical protein
MLGNISRWGRIGAGPLKRLKIRVRVFVAEVGDITPELFITRRDLLRGYALRDRERGFAGHELVETQSELHQGEPAIEIIERFQAFAVIGVRLQSPGVGHGYNLADVADSERGGDAAIEDMKVDAVCRVDDSDHKVRGKPFGQMCREKGFNVEGHGPDALECGHFREEQDGFGDLGLAGQCRCGRRQHNNAAQQECKSAWCEGGHETILPVSRRRTRLLGMIDPGQVAERVGDSRG